MKSYWINKTPTGTELELRDQPVPTPGPEQVLIRICTKSYLDIASIGIEFAPRKAEIKKPNR